MVKPVHSCIAVAEKGRSFGFPDDMRNAIFVAVNGNVLAKGSWDLVCSPETGPVAPHTVPPSKRRMRARRPLRRWSVPGGIMSEF
jgi:hypothetical protein